MVDLGPDLEDEVEDPGQEPRFFDGDIENGIVPFPVGIVTAGLHNGCVESEYVASHDPDVLPGGAFRDPGIDPAVLLQCAGTGLRQVPYGPFPVWIGETGINGSVPDKGVEVCRHLFFSECR